MSRRHRAEKREIIPDRSSATRRHQVHELGHVRGQEVGRREIVYGAFDIIEKKTKQDPLAVFQQALDNVMPRSRCARAASAAPPTRCRSRCARAPPGARHPLAHHGGARPQRKDHGRAAVGELLDAANNRGNAVKKREDTHRMAEANRAFSHYRW
jgi:small subunit ribosomal protein S7